MYLQGEELIKAIERLPKVRIEPKKPQSFQTHVLIKDWRSYPQKHHKTKCGHDREICFDADLQDQVDGRYKVSIRFWECAVCGTPQQVGLSVKEKGVGGSWKVSNFTYNETHEPTAKVKREERAKLLKALDEAKKEKVSSEIKIREIEKELYPYGRY